MMRTKYYQIHNFLSFSIKNKNNFLKKLLDTTKISFENFEVQSSISDCDFMIEIGPFKPKKKESKILDDNYHIKNDFMFLSDSRKFAKWYIEVLDLEGFPKIKIQTNTAGSVTKPLNLIEFLIQYKLLQKNYSIIHAAGIEKNGNVILLPGTSGGGKTTISLSLTELNFNFLGDNYIIIHQNKAFSYLTPLNVFYYNQLSLIQKALSNYEKLDLFIRKKIYQVTGGYIKIFKKVNPHRIIGRRIRTSGNIERLCFIEPNNNYDSKKRSMNRIDINEAAKKMRFNMELEWIQFCKYFYSYGFLRTQSLFGEFWEKYESTLKKNLDSVKEIYCMSVPVNYSKFSIYKTISDILSLNNIK